MPMSDYKLGYRAGLEKALEICGKYRIEWTKQSSQPAKITAACANNIIDFVCDDIEAHRISNSVEVFPVDLGTSDHPSSLPSDLGSAERRQKKPVGILKSFGGGIKKRGS